MLLNRLFCPPREVPGTPAETTWGIVLTKSEKLRPKVGRRLITSPVTVPEAPVRDGDSSGFSLADTVIPATSTAVRLSEKSRTKRWPKVSVIPVPCSGANPSARTSSV